MFNFIQQIGRKKRIMSQIYIAPNGNMYKDVKYNNWSCSLLIFGIFPEHIFNLGSEKLIDENLTIAQGNIVLDFLTEQ